MKQQPFDSNIALVELTDCNLVRKTNIVSDDVHHQMFVSNGKPEEN